MKRLMREMQDNDISLVFAIESRAFTHPWPLQAFRDILSMRPWVLEAESELVGYIFYHAVLDEAVIVNFAIDPLKHRQGHGSYLLTQSLMQLKSEGCTHFYLDVRQNNSPAIRLYEKHGFTPLGIRKNYYDHPVEDAIVMGMISPINSERTNDF